MNDVTIQLASKKAKPIQLCACGWKGGSVNRHRSKIAAEIGGPKAYRHHWRVTPAV